jgi:hypothetical protein
MTHAEIDPNDNTKMVKPVEVRQWGKPPADASRILLEDPLPVAHLVYIISIDQVVLEEERQGTAPEFPVLEVWEEPSGEVQVGEAERLLILRPHLARHPAVDVDDRVILEGIPSDEHAARLENPMDVA